jgi:transposase
VQYYQWQKLLFEQGAVVFERKPNAHNMRRQESAKDEKIEQLEAKIKNKSDVMAELFEEHIKLKKGPSGITVGDRELWKASH